MLKVKCMFDRKQYNNKPQGYEVGAIQNRLANSQVEIQLQDLAEQLAKGCTFKPALLKGRKDEDWIEQQLIGLDFDSGTTIQDEVNRCYKLNILPVFGYTTFSHTEDKHKFRLVFCLDEVITDRTIRDKLVITMVKQIFKNSDEVVFNAGRLFYGGRNLIPLDYDNRINAQDILDRYYVEEIKDTKVKKVSKPIINKTNKEVNKLDKQVVNLHIEAIKSLDVDSMKRLIYSSVEDDFEKCDSEKEDKYSFSITITKTPQVIFNNSDELYQAINNIDLYDFLGIGSEYIRCIFPEHNDSNPSAHIFVSDDGTHLYKCFGCADKGYTIITLVSRLAKCSRKKAIDFIKSVYNLELQKTEWQKEAIEEFECIKEYIFSDMFEVEYPTLYSRMKSQLLKLNALLDVAIKNVYDGNDYNGKPVFFCSYKELEKVFGTTSPNSIGNTINLFALLSILNKLPEESIPEHMLKKAKHIAALKGYKKLPNHYMVCDFGFYSLSDSEAKAIKLKQNNFSMRGMSREWILRTFGIEVANEIYPQYKFENEKGVSKHSDNKTSEIVLVLFDLIDQQGYAKENQVIDILRDTYGKSKTEIQLKRSLQEILNSYDLKRIRANNQIKQQLGISDKGYPFLLLRNNE